MSSIRELADYTDVAKLFNMTVHEAKDGKAAKEDYLMKILDLIWIFIFEIKLICLAFYSLANLKTI